MYLSKAGATLSEGLMPLGVNDLRKVNPETFILLRVSAICITMDVEGRGPQEVIAKRKEKIL